MTHDNSTLAHEQHKDAGATYRRKIWELLNQTGGLLTDREIMSRIGESDINNVRPEITRLVADGLAFESMRIKCPVTGRRVRTTSPMVGAEYFNRGGKPE